MIVYVKLLYIPYIGKIQNQVIFNNYFACHLLQYQFNPVSHLSECFAMFICISLSYGFSFTLMVTTALLFHNNYRIENLITEQTKLFPLCIGSFLNLLLHQQIIQTRRITDITQNEIIRQRKHMV